MTKLPWLAFVVLAVTGCRDKEAPKPTASTTAAHVSNGPAPPSAEQLPRVDGSGPALQLDTVAGVVAISEHGALATVAVTPRGAGAGDVVEQAGTVKTAAATLASLVTTLGLPEVAKRRPSAFGADGATVSESANPIDVVFARLGHPEPASGVPVPPRRMTSAFSLAHPHDVSAGVVVFADARAPATAAVDVLALTGGFLAVRRGTTAGALAFAFDRQEPRRVAPHKPWVEVRLGKTIELEAVPAKPVVVPAIDKLGDAVTAANATAVDVLVAPETTVGEVVAALEQLRAAKVEAVGLGRVPAANSPEAAARGEQGPRVLAWDFFMQDTDDTDPPSYRKALDGTLEPALGCYRNALAKAPDLTGTARMQLIVKPDGKLGELDTGGIAAPLAACTKRALEAATFPKPAGTTKIVVQLAFVPR